MHHTTFAAGLLAALLHAPPAMAEPPVALIAKRHCAYLATGYSWDRAIATVIHDAMEAGAAISDMPPADVIGAIRVWCPAMNDGAFLSRQGAQ